MGVRIGVVAVGVLLGLGWHASVAPAARMAPVAHQAPQLPGLDLGGGCSANEVLDLKHWKLTLPSGSGGTAAEILPIDLGKVLNIPWFGTTPNCDGVVFRAPPTGVTTKGSHYPRSELREMAPGGRPASWSSDSGTHWMQVREAFTELPKGRPNLVGAQIHGERDDVSVFRLEGSKLWITDGDNPHYRLVTDNYQLGTVFDAAFMVTDGTVWAYYNRQPVAQLKKSFANAYFKAGAYTQANCGNAPCDASSYGETVIYALEVGHESTDRAGRLRRE